MPIETMEQEQVQCIICHNEIRGMVCERCMSRDIAVWLQKTNLHYKVQRYFFYELKKRMPRLTGEGFCSRCFNERPTICRKCFFSIAGNLFREISRSRSRNSKFEQTFNLGVSSNWKH
jgi:hypothetical protein